MQVLGVLGARKCMQVESTGHTDYKRANKPHGMMTTLM